MRLKRFPIHLFNDPETITNTVTVPQGSRYLKSMIIIDGIYAVYEVPQVETEQTETHTFSILDKAGIVPEGFQYVDILSCVVENVNEEGDSGTVMFPLYLKN